VLLLHLSDKPDGEIAIVVEAIASVVAFRSSDVGTGTLVSMKGGREWRVTESYTQVRDAFVAALGAEGS
jgi:hypothetical protein